VKGTKHLRLLLTPEIRDESQLGRVPFGKQLATHKGLDEYGLPLAGFQVQATIGSVNWEAAWECGQQDFTQAILHLTCEA
jgi:hypothetical protein